MTSFLTYAFMVSNNSTLIKNSFRFFWIAALPAFLQETLDPHPAHNSQTIAPERPKNHIILNGVGAIVEDDQREAFVFAGFRAQPAVNSRWFLIP